MLAWRVVLRSCPGSTWLIEHGFPAAVVIADTRNPIVTFFHLGDAASVLNRCTSGPRPLHWLGDAINHRRDGWCLSGCVNDKGVRRIAGDPQFRIIVVFVDSFRIAESPAKLRRTERRAVPQHRDVTGVEIESVVGQPSS